MLVSMRGYGCSDEVIGLWLLGAVVGRVKEMIMIRVGVGGVSEGIWWF